MPCGNIDRAAAPGLPFPVFSGLPLTPQLPFVQHLPAGFFPFQQVCYLAVVQPHAMFPAAVDDDTAAVAEIDPAHEIPAHRAFDVLHFLVFGITFFIDIAQQLDVDVEHAGNRAFQQCSISPGSKNRP